jgi:hypothetical protein
MDARTKYGWCVAVAVASIGSGGILGVTGGPIWLTVVLLLIGGLAILSGFGAYRAIKNTDEDDPFKGK